MGATALLACTAEGGGAGEETGGGSTSGEGTSSTNGMTSIAESDGSEGGSTRASESGAETDAGSTTTGSSLDGSDSTAVSSESGSLCEPTPADIEGPFYRPGIPIGGDLDVHGDPGLTLRIEGRVLDGACSPIADAVVEIWHATPVTPDGEPGDVDATYDSTAEYRYYGQVATAADGTYAFRTLRPGWYLNGANYRPAHVHLKVWIGGEERLTTQLYFVDDPFNEDDTWFNPDMALDPDDDGLAQLDIVV